MKMTEQQLTRTLCEMNRDGAGPQAASPFKRSLGGVGQEPGGHVASMLERFAASKENSQPSGDVFAKSSYIKDRQPARSILRKPEDIASLEALQDKMTTLAGELQNFKAQPQLSRRDSLNGRTGLPASALAGLTPPKSSEHLVANWQPPPRGPPHLVHNKLEVQAPPTQQLLSALADASCNYDDDGGLGCQTDTAKEDIISIPAGAVGASSAAKAAAETFESGLKQLINEVLYRQLQRTKDGATDKSRIRELADLVKGLRKCIKEMGSRTTAYIEQSVKIEREGAKRVEAAQLSTQTLLKDLEAELASTRQELAKYERELRNDKAKHGIELETSRGEVSRLNRELDRVKEERDRAREDAKRAEQQRQQLDGELKELRKTTNQQMREASVNQSEAVRILTEEKIAADSKIVSLQEKLQRLDGTAKAQHEFASVLEEEMILLRANNDNLKCAVAAKEALVNVQQEQIDKLRKELSETRGQLLALTEREQQLQQDVSRGKDDRAELAAMLEQQSAELEGKKDRLSALERRARDDAADWEARSAQMQATLSGLMAERCTLSEQLTVVKTALSAAMENADKAEARAAGEAAERAALLRERIDFQNQIETAESRCVQLDQAAAATRERLEAVEAELAASRQMLEEKNGRIDHLEGEFGALKEVLGESAAAAGETGMDIVTKLLSKIATLQSAAAAAEAVRRKLHNELVDLRGNIRVYCRVRPHTTPATRVGQDGTSIGLSVDGKEHKFSYDRVFGPDSTQGSVFDAVSELVQSALDGFHVCIFSYGQTGAGKTHTMQGGDSPMSRGIIPRAVDKILETAHKLQEQADWRYRMHASFIEIYNDKLRDLLEESKEPTYIKDQSAIKHDSSGGHTVVQGVQRVEVSDLDGALQLIRKASNARAVQATAMNSASSRSHSVFMLYITGEHQESNTMLQGCLCLVDLAGSERLARSQVEGKAEEEAKAINKSLSALGTVFDKLSSKGSHVNYRDSKLTYLLQPCLGGNGKTLMFVNINPEPASAGESLCSMRFAVKVNGCETGAKGGAKRNALTLPGGGADGEAGPTASCDPAGPIRRHSMLPRPPTADSSARAGGLRGGGDAGAARAGRAGPSRMAPSATGQKRPAGDGTGNPNKRLRGK